MPPSTPSEVKLEIGHVLFIDKELKNHSDILPMFVPTVLALVFHNQWMQWAAGLCYLALILGYTIAFCRTLS